MEADEHAATLLSHMSIVSGGAALMMMAYARRKASEADALRHATQDQGAGSDKKKGAAGHAGNFEQDGFFYKLEVKNRACEHATLHNPPAMRALS